MAFTSVGSVFPTCVGMNRQQKSAGSQQESVPHMRGDEPFDGVNVYEFSKCSPHAWG